MPIKYETQTSMDYFWSYMYHYYARFGKFLDETLKLQSLYNGELMNEYHTVVSDLHVYTLSHMDYTYSNCFNDQFPYLVSKFDILHDSNIY